MRIMNKKWGVAAWYRICQHSGFRTQYNCGEEQKSPNFKVVDWWSAGNKKKEEEEATDPTYHVLELKTTNWQSKLFKNKTNFPVRNITIFVMLDVKSKH